VLTQKYLLFAKKIAPGNIERYQPNFILVRPLDFTFDTASF